MLLWFFGVVFFFLCCLLIIIDDTFINQSNPEQRPATFVVIFCMASSCLDSYASIAAVDSLLLTLKYGRLGYVVSGISLMRISKNKLVG